MHGTVTKPDITADKLIDTMWTFGAPGQAPSTNTFRFAASGRILFYASPNEVSWNLDDGELVIYRSDGNIMWRSVACEVTADGMHIVLQAPFDPRLYYELTEFDRPGQAISDADFLVPKDLLVTPTRFQRVLLIGSCLTGIYRDGFAARFPDTIFDHILFNFVREMPEHPPAPITEYALQMINFPLRFVLTDRVTGARRFNDPGFLSRIFDDAISILDAMLDAALRFNRTSGILTLVANFIVPQMNIATHLKADGTAEDLTTIIRRLNEHIGRRIAGLRNVFLFDADALAASIGKRYVLDDTIYFLAHSSILKQEWIDLIGGLRADPVPPIDQFYPSRQRQFLVAVFDRMVAQYRSVHQIDQVKAVIFDLDNTLWRGQIAEHYRPGQPGDHARDGWPMGMWETIQHLRARGILVAICSKNDLRTVQDNWDIAVDPLFVKLSDFASVKVNWKDKSENILEICREFSIRAKNVVLVDDSPVERAAAKAAIPDLRVIGSNPYLTRRILLWAPETQVAHLTDELTGREEMVRSQIVREKVRTSLSRTDFLASLNCTVAFLPIPDSNQREFTRVLELVNKTNQFNTTGKRWTTMEIQQFFAAGGRIAAFRVKDKFADYGLVGAVFAIGPEITQFVMSCRVLGMEIEQFVLARLAAQISSEFPTATISALFRETADNTVCRDIFPRAGFSLTRHDNAGLRFEIGSGTILSAPAHIALDAWG